MRPTRPELFRPRHGPDQLAWAVAAVTGLLSLVLWVFQLVLDIRGKSGAYPDVFTAAVVTAWLLVLMRLTLILRLPRSAIGPAVRSGVLPPRVVRASGSSRAGREW